MIDIELAFIFGAGCASAVLGTVLYHYVKLYNAKPKLYYVEGLGHELVTCPDCRTRLRIVMERGILFRGFRCPDCEQEFEMVKGKVLK